VAIRHKGTAEGANRLLLKGQLRGPLFGEFKPGQRKNDVRFFNILLETALTYYSTILL
jgi:hypothetical protein